MIATFKRGFFASVVLLACTAACAQETHFRTTVDSGDAQFSVDLSNLNSTAGATITIRNNSGSTVSMPWISDSTAMPPLAKHSIVSFLRTNTSTDEEFAVAAWHYVMNQTTGHCSAGSAFDRGGSAADPMRIFFGYGIGCCDQQSELLAWLWDAAAYPTRVAIMDFHTVPEIYFSGAWHLLDPNHQVIYHNADGTIASVSQVLADPTIVANTADANGNDPIGWSAETMAELYAANASSLRYVTGPWPEPATSELNLLPMESLQLRGMNPWPDQIYHPISDSEVPLGPAAFGTARLTRWMPYSDAYWSSRASTYQGVATAVQTDGRSALISTGTSGSIVYSESTPFPILSLHLTGEFLRADTTATASAYFSSDGKTWSPGVPVALGSTLGAAIANVDLTRFARGSYGYFVKVQFDNATAGSIGVYDLKIASEGQMASQMFPQLVAGQVNTLEYRDLSPGAQVRQVSIEVAIPTGRPGLQGLSATSQVGESPVYSIARNYQARRLVDGDGWSLAYPGSTAVDYIVHLPAASQVTQATIWWGMFGSNPIYVNNWKLYGRSSPATPWQVLAGGTFPDCEVCDIPLTTAVSDLRLVASGNNWIGAYEVAVYGDELVPLKTDAGRTAISNIGEDPTYSLAANYSASNLIDGNSTTLAYPGSSTIDYSIGLGNVSHLSSVDIMWGYFGLNPIYIADWSLLGRNGSSDWSRLADGVFPGTDTTSLSLDTYATDLRVVAHSAANWIGAYEVGIASTNVLTPVQTTSNVPDSGPYSHPTSNLTDGDELTLAYPGTAFADYELDFGADTYLDFTELVWGYFGTNPIYVGDWTIYGQQDGDLDWVPIARGGYPAATVTTVPVRRVFRRIRITARSLEGNWIGVFEAQVWGARLGN